jgi:hypothetical protein
VSITEAKVSQLDAPDNTAFGTGNPVDDWFADFNQDGLPELAVGRLPVQTSSDAAAVVAKLLAYDQGSPGSWSREALLGRRQQRHLRLTLGEAARQAKAATIDLDVRRTWILFGDPTVRLK